MEARAISSATITAKVIRANGTVEEYTVPASVSHPWKPWQIWWWTKIRRKPLPVRGHIPNWHW